MIKFAATFRNIVKSAYLNLTPISKTTVFAFAGRKGRPAQFLSPQTQQQRDIWKNFVIKIDDLLAKNQHAEGEQLIENYLEERFFQKQDTLQDPQKILEYLGALNLKSSLEIISRKFDKVLTNIDNQLYLIHKFQLASKEVHQQIIKLYNQYILVLILHNHDRLRSFLIEDKTQSQTKLKKGQKQKQKQGFQKKFKIIYLHSSLPTARYTQALVKFRQYMIGLCNFGIVQKCIFNFDRAFEHKQKKFLAFQSFYYFDNLQRQSFLYEGNARYEDNKTKYNSQKVRLFTLNMLLQKKKIKFQQVPTAISPQDSQWMVNSVLGYLLNQNVQWDDLDAKRFNHFFKPLYLIAENYYLSGEVEQSKRILNKLKAIKPNKQQAKMLYKFLGSMYLYDQKKYKQCIEEIDLKEMNDMKSIFKIQNLVNDTLRKNIFMIASKSYEQLNQVQNCQDMEIVADIYESMNDLYTVNQLDNDQQNERQPGIAPYYLNIELKQTFGF